MVCDKGKTLELLGISWQIEKIQGFQISQSSIAWDKHEWDPEDL